MLSIAGGVCAKARSLLRSRVLQAVFAPAMLNLKSSDDPSLLPEEISHHSHVSQLAKKRTRAPWRHEACGAREANDHFTLSPPRAWCKQLSTWSVIT